MGSSGSASIHWRCHRRKLSTGQSGNAAACEVERAYASRCLIASRLRYRAAAAVKQLVEHYSEMGLKPLVDRGTKPLLSSSKHPLGDDVGYRVGKNQLPDAISHLVRRRKAVGVLDQRRS